MFQRATAVFYALVLVLLAGCGAETSMHEDDPPIVKQDEHEQPSYEYTETVVLFHEPEGESYSGSGWETKLGVTKVQFTNEISEDDRNAAVTEITRLMTLAQGQLGAVDVPCEIRIRGGSYAPWSYDHILYIGFEELSTQAFTVGLGQAFFGHEAAYGICYGFGVALAQEAGYPTEENTVTVEQALTLCETSPFHLDLNYACFISRYSDEETLPKVKTLAVDFYRWLTQEARQALLTDYSGALYRESLNEYLAAHGREPYNNSELDGISFYPCGSELRLIWEDPYAVFYLYDYYTVRYNVYDKIMGVDDYLNSGYENFRYIAACYLLQAEEMERVSGYLEISDKEAKVTVLFIRDAVEELRGAATFNYQDNKIRMFSYQGYAHEYVHYLTRGSASWDPWKLELFTAYYTENPGDERIYWPNVCNRNSFITADPSQPAGAKLTNLFNTVCASLDRPFDWGSPDDYRYLNDAFVVSYDRFPNIKNSVDLAVKLSFAQYLVDLVGEEAAMQAIYYASPVETFGKNWDALISEWQAKLTEEYAWING